MAKNDRGQSVENRGTGSAASPTGETGVVRFADDEPLNRMLANVIEEVKRYAGIQSRHIRKLHEIGIALSAEQDLDRLLEKILDEARIFSRADGGTLYVVDSENESLEFAIIQNDSMNVRMGGTAQPITWPPIPLRIGGEPNHSNVSSHVALTGEIINIPDVYKAEEFDFSGPRKFDANTGYRSKSMVVIPMRNKGNEIIGVLQLINEIDPVSKATVPFSEGDVTLITSLASLAAVAITNVRLYQDLEKLFESFIVTIATAIDEKSPYTAGHIRRVQELTMAIATAMNNQTEGVFKDFKLNDDEINELRIAAWLHDIGKIITPEYVVDKSTKLETINDAIHLITARFELFRKGAKLRAQEAKLRLYAAEKASSEALASIDDACAIEDSALLAEINFLVQCNQPGEYMDKEKLDRLRFIAAKKALMDGEVIPYLTEHELSALSIVKGSLTGEERTIIENHALVTMKMLKCLPFPRKLRNVPEYASYHHEKLDGTGYPFKLTADKLPYQTRIIAVADVFEALTAKDRPYKKPMTIAKSLEILSYMKKDGHIDPDIFDLFLKEKIFQEYAVRSLDKSQIDC